MMEGEMNRFIQYIKKLAKESGEAFRTFPASMACATAFALVTIFRIQLDWPQQEPYNFLFNCLHWSFAFGALLNLALTTAAQSRKGERNAFWIANAAGMLAVAVVFALLYKFGVPDPADVNARYLSVSVIATARVAVGMFVSVLMFVIFAERKDRSPAFAESFFMLHKALFLALIYGSVLMIGTSGVAGAFQALLYNDMSSKVYMYISTIVGLLSFTIFAGYFPDFHKDANDEHRDIAEAHPRFIEILLGSILIPIVLALTVVLLIWSVKTVAGGKRADFNTLYGIAAAYTLGGIWLHIMVSRYENGIAKFYKKVYPIAAAVILVFEAWALVVQLSDTGLKMTEYAFILLWLLAAISVALLALRHNRSHRIIALAASALAIVSVLPVIGYNALPVTAQSNRLEELLVSQGMLAEGNIVHAQSLPDIEVRRGITDAAEYLSYASDAKLPAWFPHDLGEYDRFKQVMGFDKEWPETNLPIGPDTYLSTMLYLDTRAVDIAGYRWAVRFEKDYGDSKSPVVISGTRGKYELSWIEGSGNSLPELRVSKNGEPAFVYDTGSFMDGIAQKYPPGQSRSTPAGLEEMSVVFDTSDLVGLIVFRYAEIHVDPKADAINYWLYPEAIYIREK